MKNWNYQLKTKEFPEYLILLIALAGFIGFMYVGVIAEWLIHLKTLLIN